MRKVSGLMDLESHKCLLITSLTVLKMVQKTQRKNQLLIPVFAYQALHVVLSNYFFASTQGDSKRFRLIFPNCPIALVYAQADAKIRFNLQIDIASYCKEQITYNVKRHPFIFKFNESTNRLVGKQYDGYVHVVSVRSWADIMAPSFSVIALVVI